MSEINKWEGDYSILDKHPVIGKARKGVRTEPTIKLEKNLHKLSESSSVFTQDKLIQLGVRSESGGILKAYSCVIQVLN